MVREVPRELGKLAFGESPETHPSTDRRAESTLAGERKIEHPLAVDSARERFANTRIIEGRVYVVQYDGEFVPWDAPLHVQLSIKFCPAVGDLCRALAGDVGELAVENAGNLGIQLANVDGIPGIEPSRVWLPVAILPPLQPPNRLPGPAGDNLVGACANEFIGISR